MNNHHLGVSTEKLVAFCDKWKIAEMSLFGSVLRKDFRPESDVDVLVNKGVRVILAHKYADIELRVIWDAAVNELPAILSNVERLIAPFESE